MIAQQHWMREASKQKKECNFQAKSACLHFATPIIRCANCDKCIPSAKPFIYYMHVAVHNRNKRTSFAIVAFFSTAFRCRNKTMANCGALDWLKQRRVCFFVLQKQKKIRKSVWQLSINQKKKVRRVKPKWSKVSGFFKTAQRIRQKILLLHMHFYHSKSTIMFSSGGAFGNVLCVFIQFFFHFAPFLLFT